MKLERSENTLSLRSCTSAQMDAVIELLTSTYPKVEYDPPIYPKWDSWSTPISVTTSGKDLNRSEYVKSGVYKIFHEDDGLIYIGETRCNGSLGNTKTRPGMWARRADFRSTIMGENIRNPYGNGLKFLEVYGRKGLDCVYHRFHYVHPLYCKVAEQEQLQMYYNEYGKLPVLQSEHDYKRIL